MPITITLDERRKLCDAHVTLNGNPAIVCGTHNDFATVATLPNGARYEYAWATVARIVANGGAFKA